MNQIVSALLIFAVGYATGNLCTDDTGYWISSLAEGVSDFAYGGTRLNTKYYCFEGCLNTGTALQNCKVDMSGNNGTRIERSREIKEVIALHQLARQRDEDPNAKSCVDPVLRQDVKNALQKTTRSNCKNIVNTLVLNLNRPGWAITCIQFNEFAIDDYTPDMNFCSYDSVSDTDIFTIRLAKLDMS
ncbi:DUF19 domain-containing protein [Caenorhabditis elegans]|uniref:DUF19 domain-containing protein n=1 Tax=Caenorhabditis elegans TaxID=6239 RepID=Q20770_CAEEL|nr:DUF19 domain-containing protein [Caenorhabditis elegans]CAA91331.1 DUF19 domain-containing protein [Caenorhabditis elegans]|eukprot:NP_496472.1 Uncharacterized protein CELE_F54D5.4 [Caenorhabditis elegans]